MAVRYEFFDKDGDGYCIVANSDGTYSVSWYEDGIVDQFYGTHETLKDAACWAAKDWVDTTDAWYSRMYPRHLGLLLAAQLVKVGLATTPEGDFWWAVNVRNGTVEAADRVFAEGANIEDEFKELIVPLSAISSDDEEDEEDEDE